jgi:hypothetical protein
MADLLSNINSGTMPANKTPDIAHLFDAMKGCIIHFVYNPTFYTYCCPSMSWKWASRGA